MRRTRTPSRRTCPFGFIDDGTGGQDQFVADGEVWSSSSEYGTSMGNWEWGQANTDW